MDNENVTLSDLQNNNIYDFLSQIDRNQPEMDNSDDISNEEPITSLYNDVNVSCNYYDELEFIDIFGKNNNCSVLSWNIQSLPSKFTEFKDCLDFYHSKGFQFDIIVLQEIWKLNDEDLFKLNGYKFICKQRSNGTGGGVGIYIRDCLKFKLLPQYSIFIEKIMETICVEIELENKKKLIITCLYRPNTHPSITQTQQLDLFIDNFTDLMAELSSLNKDTYIFGDFNIDILKICAHEKTSTFVDNCFANGFLQIITKPTRVTNSSATLIDHLYTNCIRNNFDSGIITSKISDHFPIFHFLNNSEKKKNPNFIFTRNFSETNITNFNDLLNSLSWENVLNDNNVQSSYDAFSQIFNEMFDLYFPLRKIKFNKNIHKKSPFMTKGLMISRQTKFKLSKKSIKQPTQLNIENFKKYRTLYNKLINAAKKLYYETAFEKHKLNLRKTWQILKEATRKMNDKSSIINQIIVDDVLIDDEDVICSEFDNYFTNIADKISEKINPSDRPPDSYLNDSQYEFSMGPVDHNFIIEIVSKMKAKNSTDIYGLSNNFL